MLMAGAPCVYSRTLSIPFPIPRNIFLLYFIRPAAALLVIWMCLIVEDDGSLRLAELLYPFSCLLISRSHPKYRKDDPEYGVCFVFPRPRRMSILSIVFVIRHPLRLCRWRKLLCYDKGRWITRHRWYYRAGDRCESLFSYWDSASLTRCIAKQKHLIIG